MLTIGKGVLFLSLSQQWPRNATTQEKVDVRASEENHVGLQRVSLRVTSELEVGQVRAPAARYLTHDRTVGPVAI